MRTGPSRSAVSDLDFELRKVRESQNSPGGVMAKAITPHPQRVNILSSSDYGIHTIKISEYRMRCYI